ncbi:hypothetical protein M422DRAFT_785903 [Sphaerobolus stellatus SS14]|uniref:RNase III domain-containing protein n=1 Tax=Sphaerobolus stellatus (strain SS14) TaxID=990650 RepID=A0A0C9T5V4_SPHS4|nr:hypothetical protein M422DRAFT_785903 [Sphaerobolus stellatus SS14]
MYQIIRKQIAAHIYYHPSLPDFDNATWQKVVHSSPIHGGWVADSLVYAAISVLISERFPGLGEGIFDNIRRMLGHPATYAILAQGLGVSLKQRAEYWRDLPMSEEQYTSVFKVITAELYWKEGFEAVLTRSDNLFRPLLGIVPYVQVSRPLKDKPKKGRTKIPAGNQSMLKVIPSKLLTLQP